MLIHSSAAGPTTLRKYYKRNWRT